MLPKHSAEIRLNGLAGCVELRSIYTICRHRCIRIFLGQRTLFDIHSHIKASACKTPRRKHWMKYERKTENTHHRLFWLFNCGKAPPNPRATTRCLHFANPKLKYTHFIYIATIRFSIDCSWKRKAPSPAAPVLIPVWMRSPKTYAGRRESMVCGTERVIPVSHSMPARTLHSAVWTA